MTKLDRLLDRADAWLARPAATRGMSSPCLEALAAAVDDLRGGASNVQ